MARQRAPKEDIAAPTSKAPRARLVLDLLPLIAGLLAAGGVCLHAIGAITHRTFLREMGVPPDLFPKDVAWMLINGFYALFDRWYLLFKVYADRPWEFVLYCLTLSIILTAYLYLYRWSPKKAAWVETLPPWGRALLRFSVVTISIAGTLPGAVCIVMLLMIAIGAPGEYAGKAYAEKLRERYANGCSVKAPCTDVLKDKNVVISGADLDTSPSHLAIYDPKTRLTHVLELEGLELRRLTRSSTTNPDPKK
jgi:hypothetical protein